MSLTEGDPPDSIVNLEPIRELSHRGEWRTRFAPAPTGELHIGHVVNAIHVWGIARAFGGKVVLRIEDHDRTRSRAEYERSILDDLEWLGFGPDIGWMELRSGHRTSYRQSNNGARYARALSSLQQRDLIFPCDCTRREIAQLVGHRENEELRYPGTCRDAVVDPTSTLARRVRMEQGTETFDDLAAGPQVQEPQSQCGDFLVRDRHGNWTYQFSVVVDDIEHGIDVVIRGEDLLASTGRQLRLSRMLGRKEPPVFLHHSLVLHPDGRKLSKSSGDTAIRELREAGMTPAQLLGRAVQASGLDPSGRSIRVEEISELFTSRFS